LSELKIKVIKVHKAKNVRAKASEKLVKLF